MKKILIVDDEFLVRMGIKSITDWNIHGYEIVGEASDGAEALDLIPKLKPDIVITDLKMERVGGLEVIKQSSEKYPKVKFVVLSSYNDFENVRTAMKLGAVDYIFKLTITEEQILKILDEIPIAEEKNPSSSVSTENIEAIKTRLINKVIEKSYIDVNDLKNHLKQIDSKMDWDMLYQCFLVSVDNYFLTSDFKDANENQLFKFAMQNIITEVVSEQLDASIYNSDNTELLIIIPLTQNKNILNIVESCFKTIFEYMQRYLDVTVSGVISSSYKGFENLNICYNAMKANLLQRFWKEPGYNHLLPNKNITYPQTTENKFMFDDLRRFILECDQLRVTKFLLDFFQKLQSERLDVELERGRILELYAALCVCKTNQFNIESFEDENKLNLYSVVTKYDRLYDIKNSIMNFIDQYFLFVENTGQTQKKEVVEAKQYVKVHLQDELTVQTVSAFVNMNESYFSHMFKKETGQSFIEYVVEQRIDKAKQLLLQTQMRINEVALAVGIENTNYFSVLFKKNVGKSPLEYKREIKES